MAKLLGNITFEIIKGLNRIDSLYDPQSILITYREQNVKRGRALFLFPNCLDSSGRVGWPYLLLYDHTAVSGLAFIPLLTMSHTDYTQLSCPSSQQGFVYPALSQMAGGIREHVLKLVSLGHQEADVLKYLS